MDMTQADLAHKISCSLSMLRKIERDERRPSEQLAQLLVEHLAIGDAERASFLLMARGQFVAGMRDPAKSSSTLFQVQVETDDPRENQPTFVARERELGQLHKHLAKAIAGQGQLVFIAGEAGRGKTSLLYAFARQALATRSDLIVAGGSSDVYVGQGDPLLPFRDIFRLLAGDVESLGMRGIISRELAARIVRVLPVTAGIILDHGPHLIDTLVPGPALGFRLAEGSSQQPVSTRLVTRLQEQRVRRSLSSTHELQQSHLFEEISTTLNALARQQPLLLLLDDLHWADSSSASLLGHLAKRLQHSAILIIGSFRPEELDQGRPTDDHGRQSPHPLQVVLSENKRQFGENLIDLDHPDPEEEFDFVNALLDADAGGVGADFRKRLVRLTEGFPLFVVELLRDMKERGDVVKGDDGRWKESGTMSWEHFPARVEGVIAKRIDGLPDELRTLLTVACVQGESFYAEVVAQVRQVKARDLTGQLSADLDRRHRLIREQGVQRVGTARLSQYRFRHHLFQKYLYEQLGTAERMYLHEDVGNALEALNANLAGTDGVPAAQLARHFQEARLDEKASRYLLLAGQDATRLIAFDEATAHFERGLDLLKNLPRTPEINRLEYDLWLALARTCWQNGRVAEALSATEKSIKIARSLNEPEAFARAVLAYEQPRWRLNLATEPSRQHIGEALDALGDVESGLRLQLLVSLSRVLLASGNQEKLRATVNQALHIARRIDEPVVLYDALRISVQIDRRPEMIATRIATVEEMIAIARSLGDQERLADGLALYVYDHLELGHIDLVVETMTTQKQIAYEMNQPFQLHIAAVFQTMQAIMLGQFEEAERLANEAADISEQIGIAELDGILGIHMFTIRAEQGRLQEVAPIVKLYVANNPSSASWRPGLALIYRTLGLRDECRAIFDELASDAFVSIPQDSLWVVSLAYLTDVCTFLADGDRAATLYELLLPYDGRTVVVGGATACYGAAARYLGMLAATMSDWRTAELHFAGALELDTHLMAPPWLAHSQYEYAAMLLARGRAYDRRRALSLLDNAFAVAQEIGMSYLMEKTFALRTQHEIV